MLIEIIYMVVAFVVFQSISNAIGNWAIPIGVEGPESKAKVVAIVWRTTQAVLGLAVLAILWKLILPWLDPEGSGAVFYIAVGFSILFGFYGVFGALFAAVTVPGGDQMEYFIELERKLR